MENPEAFLERGKYFIHNPEKEDFTTLILRDGRVLERYSRPQRLGDQIIGCVWSFRDVTERYQADSELRKLSRAIEASPVSVVITDTKGTIQYVNPKFSELTGYTAEEAIGQNPRILQSGTHTPDFYKEMWLTIVAGNVWHGEFCNCKKNGELYWESAAIAPVKDKQGNITHYVAVKEDITERREMEIALRKNEERLLEAAKISNLGYFELNFRTMTFTFDNLLWDLLGTSIEEEGGETIQADRYLERFCHPEDRAIIEQHIQRALSTKEAIEDELEYRVNRKDGIIRNAYVRYRIELDEAGTPKKGYGFHHDITERKQSQEEYQLILQTALDGYWLADTQGRFLEVNESYCQLIGYTRDELLTMRISELEAKEDPDEVAKQINKVIKQGYDRFETRHIRKDGVVIDVEISAQYTDLRGGVLIVFLRDITQRKKTEMEVMAAKETAEVASQIKSAFLANMSHEIRTPLNAVIGFLELVLEDPSLNDQHWKHLATAQRSAGSLLGVINDILDISKLETGKLTIEQHPFSVSQLMHEIQSTMIITAHEKGLDLQLDIQPSVSGAFIGDPLRLRQILMNLVSNAIKFTKEGGVFVRVMSVEEKNQLHFMVEDTGMGIPADRLSQIFEAFAQADTSTTRQYGGTGLGTTIARELVELMGGRIWAESEEGKGSTFHFTIKLTPTDQIRDDDGLFIVPGKEVLPSVRSGFRILLVEDVEANVDLAKIRLEQQGHKVTVAWNGIEAVEAFEQGEFDVILMDIQMPRMGGPEATERIRAIEGSTARHVPIIAMTAAVMREETEKYLEGGMDAVVAKPINFGKLFRAMETLIPEGVGEMVAEIQEDVSAPSELELPPLDGVDIEKGIQTWQNKEAYTKALLGFSLDYGNAAVESTRLIDEGDIDSAARMVHKLKGVTGNLSITEVYDTATGIDTGLKENRIEDVKNQLVALATVLNRAVDSIRQLETVQDVEETQKKETDVAHLKALFIKMLAAFNRFDPNAVEPYLSELKEYLSLDQLSPIEKHLERFDFDKAKRETLRLAKTLQIELEGNNGKR